MINFEYFLVFVITGAALAAAPGPSLLFIVSQSIRFGFWPVAPAALGLVFASLTYAILALLGAATILETFPTALIVGKLVGAAYLISLAIRQIRSSGTFQVDTENQAQSARLQFTRGLFVGLSNPKTMLFYLLFIPQFLDPVLPFTPQLAVYNTVQLCTLAAVTFGYAASADALRGWIFKPSSIGLMNQIAGGILIFAATLMVVSLIL